MRLLRQYWLQWTSGQLPHPARADALAEGGACTPARRVGLTRSKSACGAGPDASGDLIVGVLHSTPCRTRETERRVASRSLRRTRLRGRLTATRPCRETHRGLGGTPALTDCLWPVMDSRKFVAPGITGSHALVPSLLARFARSLRKRTPRDRRVESPRSTRAARCAPPVPGLRRSRLRRSLGGVSLPRCSLTLAPFRVCAAVLVPEDGPARPSACAGCVFRRSAYGLTVAVLRRASGPFQSHPVVRSARFARGGSRGSQYPQPSPHRRRVGLDPLALLGISPGEAPARFLDSEPAARPATPRPGARGER